ncbi:hypothetical protein F5Y06DRAFT_296584 [Hypoxylon sp. FL0890]|nr:hypothetical protein F5Y06DRAFT_296584 [Hypoxylon sp. FL0890]
MAVLFALSTTSAPSLPQPTSDGGLGVRGDTLVTLTMARESSTCTTVIELGKTQYESDQAAAACCTGEPVTSTSSVVPPAVQDSAPTPSSSSDNSANTALIVLGVVLGLSLVVLLIGWLFCCRRPSTRLPPPNCRQEGHLFAAHLGLRDLPALQVLQALLAKKDHQDRTECRALVVLLDPLGLPGDRLDLKDPKDSKVQWACKVHVAEKARQVRWAHKAIPALTVPRVHKVQSVHKALLVGHRDLLGRKDYRGHLDLLDLRDLPAPQTDHQVHKAPRAHKVIMVPWVRKDLRVDRQAPLDHQDLLGLSDRKGHRDLATDHQDQLGLQGLQELQAPQAPQAPLALLDLDYQGRRGHLDHLGLPVMGLWDLRDRQDHQVPRAPPEDKGHQVDATRARKVLQVLQVPLALPARWAQHNAVAVVGTRAEAPVSAVAEKQAHVEATAAVSVVVVIKT